MRCRAEGALTVQMMICILFFKHHFDHVLHVTAHVERLQSAQEVTLTLFWSVGEVQPAVLIHLAGLPITGTRQGVFHRPETLPFWRLMLRLQWRLLTLLLWSLQYTVISNEINGITYLNALWNNPMTTVPRKRGSFGYCSTRLSPVRALISSPYHKPLSHRLPQLKSLCLCH